MKPIVTITLIALAPLILSGIYLICRAMNLTTAIDPAETEEESPTDNADFDAEVEALIESRKTKN